MTAIPSVSSGIFTTAAGSFNLTLPTGSVAGSRIALFVAEDATTQYIFAQEWIVDSTEASNGYIVYSPAATATLAFVMYRVTGAGSITFSSVTNGTSTSPDAPNHTGNGAIWITAIAWDGTGAHSSYPTNYTDNQTTERFNDPSEGIAIAVASRTLTASSENPGAHTLSASSEWGAITACILPDSTGGSAVVTFTPDIEVEGYIFTSGWSAPYQEEGITISGRSISKGSASTLLSSSTTIQGSTKKIRFINGHVLFSSPSQVAFDKECCCQGECILYAYPPCSVCWSCEGDIIRIFTQYEDYGIQGNTGCVPYKPGRVYYLESDGVIKKSLIPDLDCSCHSSFCCQTTTAIAKVYAFDLDSARRREQGLYFNPPPRFEGYSYDTRDMRGANSETEFPVYREVVTEGAFEGCWNCWMEKTDDIYIGEISSFADVYYDNFPTDDYRGRTSDTWSVHLHFNPSDPLRNASWRLKLTKLTGDAGLELHPGNGFMVYAPFSRTANDYRENNGTIHLFPQHPVGTVLYTSHNVSGLQVWNFGYCLTNNHAVGTPFFEPTDSGGSLWTW